MPKKLGDVGVPVTMGEKMKMTQSLHDQLERDLAELAQLGVVVHGIAVEGDRVAPRFYIEFPRDAASFVARTRLEGARFDVGQEMGDKTLRFYASRRVVETTGWD